MGKPTLTSIIRRYLADFFFWSYLWARGITYDDYVNEVYGEVARSLNESNMLAGRELVYE